MRRRRRERRRKIKIGSRRTEGGEAKVNKGGEGGRGGKDKNGKLKR